MLPSSGNRYSYRFTAIKFVCTSFYIFILFSLIFTFVAIGAMAEGDALPPCPPVDPFVTILEDGFGFVTDVDGKRHIVRRYTLSNQNALNVQIINYGGTITSIKFPDKYGVSDDIALGFDDIEGYQGKNNPYFGALVGRVANRIAKGHFKIDKKDFQLSTNSGENHLHGGIRGFDKVMWDSEIQGTKLVLTYLSKDGEEGYPGEVLATAIYELTTENELKLTMKANTTKATPINLTNHSYFNLAGHATGAAELYKHLVSINADQYTPTDDNQIPTGMLKNVGGTLWDLRVPRVLGDVINHVPGGGYDHNLCIHRTNSENITFVARVIHPDSGRILEIYSDQPGVQFYTGNKLPRNATEEVVQNEEEENKKNVAESKAMMHGSGLRRCPICGYLIRDPDFEEPPEECCSELVIQTLVPSPPSLDNRLIGREGVEYNRHGAFVLYTQNFPDAPHRKNFPNSIIRPGEVYSHKVFYKFAHYEEPELDPEDTEVYEEEWAGEAGEMDQPADDLLGSKLEENGR